MINWIDVNKRLPNEPGAYYVWCEDESDDEDLEPFKHVKIIEYMPFPGESFVEGFKTAVQEHKGKYWSEINTPYDNKPQYEKMNGWIDVRDKLPEPRYLDDGWLQLVWVLVKYYYAYPFKNYHVCPACYDARQKIWIIPQNAVYPIHCNALIDGKDLLPGSDFVSHWMPLPEAPKED